MNGKLSLALCSLPLLLLSCASTRENNGIELASLSGKRCLEDFTDLPDSILTRVVIDRPRIAKISAADWFAQVPVIEGEDNAWYDWRPINAVEQEHQGLYQEAGIPQPTGSEPMISVFETSNHWVEKRLSLIATRSEKGLWRVQRLKWLRTAGPASPFSQETYALDDEVSAELDLLLANECMWVEPTYTRWSHLPSSEGAEWTMRISTAEKTRVVRSMHVGMGRTALIYHALSRRAAGPGPDVSDQYIPGL